MYSRCYLAEGCEGDEACVTFCPDRRREPSDEAQVRQVVVDVTLLLPDITDAENVQWVRLTTTDGEEFSVPLVKLSFEGE